MKILKAEETNKQPLLKKAPMSLHLSKRGNRGSTNWMRPLSHSVRAVTLNNHLKISRGHSRISHLQIRFKTLKNRQVLPTTKSFHTSNRSLRSYASIRRSRITAVRSKKKIAGASNLELRQQKQWKTLMKWLICKLKIKSLNWKSKTPIVEKWASSKSS